MFGIGSSLGVSQNTLYANSTISRSQDWAFILSCLVASVALDVNDFCGLFDLAAKTWDDEPARVNVASDVAKTLFNFLDKKF